MLGTKSVWFNELLHVSVARIETVVSWRNLSRDNPPNRTFCHFYKQKLRQLDVCRTVCVLPYLTYLKLSKVRQVVNLKYIGRTDGSCRYTFGYKKL